MWHCCLIPTVTAGKRDFLMRALAEFIIRGRMQAGLVAFFGNLAPLVSPAAVSLVTLTRGSSEGFLLVLWALMPLLVIFFTGNDANAIVTLLSIVSVVCVWLVSELMRLRSSWSEALISIVALSATSAILVAIFFADNLTVLEALIVEFFKETQQYENKFAIGRNFLVGVIAYVVALTSVFSLMLGRWWQAALYNPGGFKLEFHQLRFSVTSSVIILTGIFIFEYFLQDYSSWTSLLSLPLLLSGIALLHYSVTFFQLNSYWLLVFYVALLFLSPLSIMLVGVGFLDSIFNIRSRLSRYS